MKGYDKITNPATGRKVSVYGKTGQQIINNYRWRQELLKALFSLEKPKGALFMCQ